MQTLNWKERKKRREWRGGVKDWALLSCSDLHAEKQWPLSQELWWNHDNHPQCWATLRKWALDWITPPATHTLYAHTQIHTDEHTLTNCSESAQPDTSRHSTSATATHHEGIVQSQPQWTEKQLCSRMGIFNMTKESLRKSQCWLRGFYWKPSALRPLCFESQMSGLFTHSGWALCFINWTVSEKVASLHFAQTYSTVTFSPAINISHL